MIRRSIIDIYIWRLHVVLLSKGEFPGWAGTSLIVKMIVLSYLLILFLSGSAGHSPGHIFGGRVTEEWLFFEKGEKGVVLSAHSGDINFIIDWVFHQDK